MNDKTPLELCIIPIFLTFLCNMSREWISKQYKSMLFIETKFLYQFIRNIRMNPFMNPCSQYTGWFGIINKSGADSKIIATLSSYPDLSDFSKNHPDFSRNVPYFDYFCVVAR